ncbi:STAS domain-containing protein [Pullulanibacillus sp. KACC 23026]|uniref:STAS domain-containing protein n=1 Tax=Pullulanibacillus sp. KACC 23026 TaxID=3028315 RepID=UPI0023B206B7|nr:STAS domain-containing protein [Pullulanibacillus sp. KACC 23026]WEG12106.1 STAS domain-containing protein [Pullulanibacillus sp. KACC 23026]
MELSYRENSTVKQFIIDNQSPFEQELLDEAINVKDKINEILFIGNIDLLKNAHKLVMFVVEKKEEELVAFAKQEGVAWAKYSLTLAFKLEWIHAIRRTLWKFLNNYQLLNKEKEDSNAFFTLEKNINDYIDQFLTHFFISYSTYKDELIEKQRELVENLSVPIIPINKEIRILPLIGSIDTSRVRTIQEKVLEEIGKHHIRTLIIDLSGITPMEEVAVYDFKKIIEANSMMGCQTIITGLRSDIVKNFVNIGINLRELAEFKGTLELALNDILFENNSKI